MQQQDLSYDSIISNIYIVKCFKKSIEFLLIIKDFKFFITLFEIFLEKDNKEIINRKDNKEILIKLSIMIIIIVNDRILSINYRFIEDEIKYD